MELVIYFAVPLLAVWVSLGIVLLTRWAISNRRWRDRSVALAPIEGRGVNWYYAAILACCLAVPLASVAYCEGQPRLSKPHGLFMLGLYAIGTLLFIAGQARAGKFSPMNSVFVPIIFVVLAAAVELLWLMNFASNFSV